MVSMTVVKEFQEFFAVLPTLSYLCHDVLWPRFK